MANQSTQSEPKVLFNSQLSGENGSKSNKRTAYEDDDEDKNENKPGFFRKAIPIMPKPLAVVCCFLNIIIPGFGKLALI